MLRLRICSELWESCHDPEGFREVIERYLRDGPVRLFTQLSECSNSKTGQKELVQCELMLVSDSRIRLLLRPSSGGGCDYEIIGVEHASPRDRQASYLAKALDDRIMVLSPEQSLVGDFAIVFRIAEFRSLARYLRMPISLGWARLKRGRRISRVVEGNTAMFLFESITQGDFCEAGDLEAMAEALDVADCGCVVTDAYELRLIRRLVESYGGLLS